MVKKKTFWTPVYNVKVTLSLLLERIRKKYESFERFHPVLCTTFSRTRQFITLTALCSIYDQNQLNLLKTRSVASFDNMIIPSLKIIATFDSLNG